MRRTLALLGVLLLGCAAYQSPETDNLTFHVALAPDSVLRVASTQLLAHGFTVIAQPGGHTIATAARPVPSDLPTGQTRSGPTRYWTLRLDATEAMFTSGTSVRVAGFLLPEPPTPAGSTTATQQRAIPITAQNAQLFAEVKAVAGWVEDAARRRR